MYEKKKRKTNEVVASIPAHSRKILSSYATLDSAFPPGEQS